jgi:hypothetical protein
MSSTIADLFKQLKPDDVRNQLKFSREMAEAHEKMFATTNSDDIAAELAQWLTRHQPCLFGRMSAKAGLMSYCILTETDLTATDQAIRDKIQDARLQWTRDGFEGKKSGFVVLAVSPKLATAAPGDVMKNFAQRLCALHLLEYEKIEPDNIYVEEIFLEIPGAQRKIWKWIAGVNVFAAAGDGRWWQDHRIPGGLGFSVNSVGHLVKSKIMQTALRDFRQAIGETANPFPTTAVGSLPSALEFAMRTIRGATDAASGKATELLPLPADPRTLRKCPFELSPYLKDFDYCEYQGYYHTDITVPSEYFRPDITRPANISAKRLDFTYLFDVDVNNPSNVTMGTGRRIRQGGSVNGLTRRRRVVPEQVSVDTSARLAKALAS